jgi:alkyl hydroperoxide reductase subunit AhpC
MRGFGFWMDIGRSTKEILRLVQAFRHFDLTGEAMAFGWIPGD